MTTQRFLTGLIGRDIGATRSPEIHEREADALGVRLIYTPHDFARLQLEEADLPRMLAALELAGYAGVNVTHPYKQAVMRYLDELTPTAAEVGAVNCVAFRDGRRVGHNTDAVGFERSFAAGMRDVRRQRVLLLGAGGAGCAAAHALLSLGVERLAVFDVDAGRSQALVERLQRHGDATASVVAELDAEVAASDGVVNATPIGMVGHPGVPLPLALLAPRQWIVDVIYFPLETEWLAAARRLGCRTMNGSGMVVHQAAAAFEMFTGIAPRVDRMQAGFEAGTRAAQG